MNRRAGRASFASVLLRRNAVASHNEARGYVESAPWDYIWAAVST